jgi:hypothetical protein
MHLAFVGAVSKRNSEATRKCLLLFGGIGEDPGILSHPLLKSRVLSNKLVNNAGNNFVVQVSVKTVISLPYFSGMARTYVEKSITNGRRSQPRSFDFECLHRDLVIEIHNAVNVANIAAQWRPDGLGQFNGTDTAPFDAIGCS